MDLLTLNLNKPLSWSRAAALEAGIISPATAIAALAAAPEDAEAVLYWDYYGIVHDTGDDGPSAVRPCPAPASIAATGLATASLAGSAAVNDAEPAERLEPGRYLFVQTRPPAGLREPAGDAAIGGWLADTVEWFAREAWWTKASASGPLILRLVHEDHQTAVQLLRHIE
jgi:hypothetical protein